MKRTRLRRSTPETVAAWRGRSRRLPARGSRLARLEADLPAARRAVLERAGGRCEYDNGTRCGRRASDVHHRCLADRPRGRHDPDRMVALCSEHHRWVHDNPAASYESGWLIRSNTGPGL